MSQHSSPPAPTANQRPTLCFLPVIRALPRASASHTCMGADKAGRELNKRSERTFKTTYRDLLQIIGAAGEQICSKLSPLTAVFRWVRSQLWTILPYKQHTQKRICRAGLLMQKELALHSALCRSFLAVRSCKLANLPRMVSQTSSEDAPLTAPEITVRGSPILYFWVQDKNMSSSPQNLILGRQHTCSFHRDIRTFWLQIVTS